MSTLALVTSTKALLTATVQVANPDKPGETIFVGNPCKIDGSKLGPGDAPVPVYRDLYTGKTYAMIAEVIPSAPDAASVAAAKAIRDQNPIHFVSDDGSVKGWFVEAPVFDESIKPAPAAPAAASNLPGGVRSLLGLT